MKDYSKVKVVTRVVAALIDGLISYFIGFIPAIGAIIGAVYMLFKDGLFEGQSVGKKVMNIQVITERGIKADFGTSAKRNVIFALPIVIMIIPVIGWILAPIISLIILVIEFMKVLNEPKGRRIGDTWAGTQVIDFQGIVQGEADGVTAPAQEETSGDQQMTEQD